MGCCGQGVTPLPKNKKTEKTYSFLGDVGMTLVEYSGDEETVTVIGSETKTKYTFTISSNKRYVDDRDLATLLMDPRFDFPLNEVVFFGDVDANGIGELQSTVRESFDEEPQMPVEPKKKKKSYKKPKTADSDKEV